MTSDPSKPHFSILATSFAGGPRPRNAALILSGLWLLIFCASLFTPPLLDDADATHAQAARAMLATGDYVTLHVDGIRYLEKAPLPYWLTALSFRLFGFNTFAAHLPLALAVALLALLGHRWANQAFGARTAFYTSIATLTSFGVFLFTRILIPEVLLSLFLCTALFAFLKSLEPSPSNENNRVPHVPTLGRGLEPAQTSPETEQPSIAWYAGPHFYPYVMWSTLALAVLTKGLVAPLFFFATTIAYLTLTATWSDWRRLKPFTGLLIFLAIAAPWHILAALRNPATAGHQGFLWFYFWNEHVLRFLGRRIPHDYNKLPGYAFWLQHLVWLFPWSLFLPLGVTAIRRRITHQVSVLTASAGKSDQTTYNIFLFTFGILVTAVGDLSGYSDSRSSEIFFVGLLAYPCIQIFYRRNRTGLPRSPFHRIDPQQRSILLLSLFAAIVLLFFSLSTNQEYYTFPAYLPILLLISATITRAEQTYSTSPEARRWITFAHASLVALGTAAALALCFGLWTSRHLPYNPDIGTLLAHRDVGGYTLATSHLFDLTGPAFAALRLPAVLAALALLLGPLLAWHLRMQRRHLAATTTISFTAAAFLFSAHLALARFAPLLSSADMAQTIQRLEHTGKITPDTQVLLYGDQAFGSSIPFYLGHPVELVEGRSTSLLFGSTFPDAPPIFLTNADLLTTWGHGRRKILFVSAELQAKLPHLPGSVLLQQTSGKQLLTDRPTDH